MSNNLLPEEFDIVTGLEEGGIVSRTLNTNSPSNQSLLEDFQTIDDILTIPYSTNSCFDLSNLPKTTEMSTLLSHLCELMIRFDSAPNKYQKADYEHFIKTITNALIYLYTKDQSTSDLENVIHFMGIATLGTDPQQERISNGYKYPGMYLANTVGVYTNFGIEVTTLVNSIVYFFPKIVNGLFTGYEKFTYNIDGSKWELVEGLLRTKDGVKITLQDINEIDSVLGDENTFLNKKGEFLTPITSHKDVTEKNSEAGFQHVTQGEKATLHTHNNKESLDNYNPTLFATALQGEKADSALQSLPLNTVVDEDYSALKDKVNGIEENANNYQHPLQHSTAILAEVNPLAGSPDKYLNERGNFTKPSNTHKDVTDKNAETDYQHVDTTITKETLVEADKVAILDSVTGKVVLTNKSNVSGGGSTDITLKNENIGSAGTVVVDTSYDWHVVSKTSGGARVFTFDFANGVLPTKNKEYLIILKNDSVDTLTVTMPTGSITVGGVVFNFNNSISIFPLNAGKTAEINVIAVYTGSTTCNIRITTQSSI